MENETVYVVMETRDWDGDPAYTRGVTRTLEGCLKLVKDGFDSRQVGDFAAAEKSLREWWPGPPEGHQGDRYEDEWVYGDPSWEEDQQIIVTKLPIT